jgi:hypothetical protein
MTSGVATIVNPITTHDHLTSRTIRHCYDDMRLLLRAIATTFTKPTARIVVTGYYPIFSRDSDPVGVRQGLAGATRAVAPKANGQL